MNFLKISSLTVLSIAFLGACRVETPDGKIPQKHISDAKKVEGTYTGSFENKPAQFTISVEDDGTASLSYSDNDGDIVGHGCQSRIGALRAVWASSKKVGGAAFALSTACPIEGKHVLVDFNKNGKAALSVVKESYQERREVCEHGETICNPNGGCYTRPPRCRTEYITRYDYLQGKFQKN